MDKTAFWNLIDSSFKAVGGDVEAQAEALVQALGQMPVADILAFERHLDYYSRNAYDARLFAAAALLDDLSDDDFDDFRLWLISRGEEIYSRCLDDPEALAQFVQPDDMVTAGEIGAVALRAYEQKTGMDDFSCRFNPKPYPKMKNSSLRWRDSEGCADPKKLRKLFPKLWEQFGYRFDEEDE